MRYLALPSDSVVGYQARCLWVIALAVGASLTLWSAGASSGWSQVSERTRPSARVPRTVVSTRNPIVSFAQDGARIAWIDSGRGCKLHLHIFKAASRRAVVVTRLGVLGECDGFGRGYYGGLALAGSQALWKVFTGSGNTETDVGIRTASVQDPNVRRVENLHMSRDPSTGTEAPDPPLAGRRNLLVYYSQQELSSPSGYFVKRVVGHRGIRVFDTQTRGAPLRLAVDRNRIAAVWPWEGKSSLLEVRTAAGVLISTFSTKGVPHGLAFSGPVVVLLASGGRGETLRLFDASSGASRGSVRVPTDTEDEIGASGRWIVFLTGKTIRLLDVKSRKTLVAAVGKQIPFGLSITGRRVAWAENLAHGGRIRSISVPG